MAFTNFTLVPAPAAVLALLGTAAATVALLAAAAVSGLAGRPALVRATSLAAVALSSFYALLLVGLGAATPARVVPRGAEKFFCEITATSDIPSSTQGKAEKRDRAVSP
ncbi:MAG TPA: hypothetical protein VGM13_03755 [Thermoanaerobaculia bacterium]|jgi:hypothetical protein